jgi:sulfite exporter TauE/SafE
MCEIEYNQKDVSELESVINQAWYTIWEEDSKQPWTSDQRAEKIAWLVLAWVLVFALMKTNINWLIPDYTDLSFGVAFIIGLVASISTCLAVTGGIIIWYNESVQTTNAFWTQIKFHIGRIISFVVWWALLGLVWSQFWGSVRFNAIFSVLVGVVLLYLGLQLLWVVPNITKRWFHLPSWLSQTIFNLKNPKYAGIVWALTFLLPCGFTQSMQLYALQSSSPVQWALIMWAFALGTLPVLFWVWLGTKYIKDKLILINPLIASLLVVFWLYTIYNGTILAQALTTSNQNNTTRITAQNLETETVQVGHNWSQFVPSSIKLAVGKNYKLVVTPSSDGRGCMSQVIIPGKWPHSIKQWESFEIDVDGSSVKTIKLVCASMGMGQGEIVVQ